METPSQILPRVPLDPPPAAVKRGRGRPSLPRSELSPENDTPKPHPRRNPKIPSSPSSYYRELREGDLVWARIKTHPHWWPGRVGSRRENESSALLVSLFGDGAIGAAAWCEPTQLKPFREEFDPMVRQSVAKGFVDSVRAAMDEFAEGQFGTFAPRDFLSRVRSVAVDVFSCGLLESAVLKSWMYAFVRENGVRVVNLTDLADVEIADPMSSPRRKKRSMVELIAVPNTGDEEVTDTLRKWKQKEGANVAEVSGGASEEEIGSPRTRERKKSKYLSPPYTFGSFEDGSEGEAETISADVMLSHLLRAAIEPLKWNGLDAEIRHIFNEFRKLVTSRKAGFGDHLEEFVSSRDFDTKTTNGIVDVSVGKSNVVEVEASGQAALSIGNVTRKRGRSKKVQSVGENPVNLAHHIDNDSPSKSSNGIMSKKKENGANGGTGVDLDSERGKNRHKSIDRKALANDPDFGHSVAKLGISCRARKSGVEAPNGGIQSLTLVGNGTEGGRATRQMMRKKEGNAATPWLEPKAPVPYLRENLEKMILALAGSSSDVVLSDDLKPEVKENLAYEMHALLHKVKNLQTGTSGTST